MSQINVNTIRSRNGGPPNLDKGAVVTGIVTATSAEFAGNVSVGGTLTYEDVTNIDSTGIVTAKSGIFVGNPVSPGIGATINPNGNAVFAGIVTANSLRGDGSLLTGIDATAIQTGNTSVQTVDTGSDGHVKMTTEGSERVRVGPAGQIGLGGANYGTSGQLLTSAGSGSAPTWSTVSSAPEVTGISSGAITAGQPIQLTTDGKLENVKYIYTTNASTQNGGGQSIAGGMGDAYWATIAYDSNRNQFLYFWMATLVGGDPLYVTIGTPTGQQTGNNISMYRPNSSANKVHDGGTSGVPYRIAWSHTSQLGVALFRLTGNGIYAKAFTSDGTNLTFGTHTLVCSSDSSDWGDISWDKTSDKFLVVVGKDASDSNYTNAWVVSHSGTTLTVNTKAQVRAATSRFVFLKYDPDNNRHLLCYSQEDDNEKLCGRIITVSGTTPTINAETKESNPDYYGMSVDYISGGKFIIAYNRSNSCRARIVTISGTTVTFGTESSEIDGMVQVNGTYRGNHGVTCSYDTLTGKVFVSYLYSSGPSDNPYKVLTLNTSNNTISNIGSREWIRGSTTGEVNSIYVEYWMLHNYVARTGTGGGDITYYTRTTSSKSSNINAESFIGVANASYTDGQTATIRVSGSTQDNQVGLTTGQNYFVQEDGTLGLTAATPKVYAGTAVSQTKILVGKESVPTGWEIYETHNLDGSVGYIDSNNWTHVGYSRYQVIYDNVYCSSAWKPYWRIYKGDNTGETGTLLTGSNYGSGGGYQRVQTTMNQLQRTGRANSPFAKSGWNYTFTWFSGEMNFPMATGNCNNTSKTSWYGTCFRGYEHIYTADAGFYNGEENKFLTGMRMIFSTNDSGNTVNPTEGRITIMRLRVS